MPLPVVGADEAGAFQRSLEHRLQRAVEASDRRCCSGRSAITTETGSWATGGGGGRRYHQTPDDERQLVAN